jgi:hypothetical protein
MTNTPNTPRAPRTYVGNGKTSRTGNPINFSVDLDQLLELVASGAAHTWTGKKGTRNVKLTMWANAEPDRFGFTHAVCLDTFVPTGRPAEQQAPQPIDDSNDLPF